MFYYAKNFNQDINTKEVTLDSTTYTAWDVGKVTNMVYMFYKASNFNINISNWDVSKVEKMWKMFNGATKFKQSLDGWNPNCCISSSPPHRTVHFSNVVS